jgi:tRNA A37 methylthiotransferase MiaB
MDSFALCLPTGFPMDVLEIMKREPICNYIDIPLQHISDSILKSMRRGTTQENNQIIKRFPQQFQKWQFVQPNRRISGETQGNILKTGFRNEI